eukprot:1593446-Amphidinium_carterae.3
MLQWTIGPPVVRNSVQGAASQRATGPMRKLQHQLTQVTCEYPHAFAQVQLQTLLVPTPLLVHLKGSNDPGDTESTAGNDRPNLIAQCQIQRTITMHNAGVTTCICTHRAVPHTAASESRQDGARSNSENPEKARSCQ